MSALRLSYPSVNSIADAVSAALGSPGEPWLPRLASLLAESSSAWTAFDKGCAYGTARWLAADPAGIRDLVGETAIAGHPVLVEILPKALEGSFDHLSPARIVGPEEMKIVRSAAALLMDVPDLAESAGSVVRVLHILRAEAGYDVSHSEPTIPFSVFVSVPAPEEKDRVVRLAESIVHEAMHLQLTLVENVLPLVETDGEGFSPWQGRNRPVRGLLHGLYVFSVIIRFMDFVAASRPDLRRKACQRRAEIEEEVASLENFSRHLTAHGRALHAKCLRAVEG